MTTNNNLIHPQLPKLISNKFDNWYIQMHVLFRSQDLWDVINSGYIKVTNSKEFNTLLNEYKDSLKNSQKKYHKVLYAIFQAINETIFKKFPEEKKRKEKKEVGYSTTILQMWWSYQMGCKH